MTRPFAPNSFSLKSDFFANVIETRLRHSGEYVLHKPFGGLTQPVVMNYQHMPSDASINPDFVIRGNNPKLYGLQLHFDDEPRIFKEGDSVEPSKGSQFEVRGIMYNVKKVQVNHRKYIEIDLVKSNNCDEPRPEFDEEMAALLCLNVPSCENT